MSNILNKLFTLVTKKNLIEAGEVFAKGFIAVFALGVAGVLSSFSSGNFSTGRDALVALVSAAALAGVHALWSWLRPLVINLFVTTK